MKKKKHSCQKHQDSLILIRLEYGERIFQTVLKVLHNLRVTCHLDISAYRTYFCCSWFNYATQIGRVFGMAYMP